MAPSPPLDLQQAPRDRNFWIGTVLLFALAAGIRFYRLGFTGLWFDEFHTVTESTFLKPWGSPHSLFFRATSLVLPLFSNPTVAVRIIPALSGSLAVIVVMLLARRIHSTEAGWIAGALACTQPFHSALSREGRYYAPMMLFAALALLAWVRFLQGRGGRRWFWILVMILALVISVLNHPTAAAFAGGMIMVALASLALSRQGLAALAELIPSRGIPPPRRWILCAGIAGAGLACLLHPSIRNQVLGNLFHRDWGATPNVDFTWDFFAGHLSSFGLDLRRVPGLDAASPFINLGLMLLGMALLWRRSPYWTAVSVFIIVTSFVAVFAFRSGPGISYLIKYTAFLEPVVVLLIAVPPAAAVRLLLKRSTTGRDVRAPMLATAGVLLMLLHLPGLYFNHTHGFLPIRTQFRWLNANVHESSEVFVYGAMGYPASLYRGELAERHKLRYLPWVFDSGRLEAATLHHAAAQGRPVFFLKGWPWDMPLELTSWLERNGKEMARFPSREDKALDGILYKIPSPQGFDPKSRDAATLSGFGDVGRPKVIQNGTGQWAWLEFAVQAEVQYAMELRPQDNPVLEIDVQAGSQGEYFLAASAGGNTAVLLGGGFDKGGTHTLTARLPCPQAASELRIRYASDFNLQDPDRKLILKQIRVRPRTIEETAYRGQIPMGRSKPVGYPWQIVSGRPLGWRSNPADVFRFSGSPGRPLLSARIDEFKPGVFGSILAPPEQVFGGSLVHVRSRGRLSAAYGIAASPCICFFDSRGGLMQRLTLSTTPMDCKAESEPWVGPLSAEHFHEFHAVMTAPPGTASVAPGWVIWQQSGTRRIMGAANEIQMFPFEIAVFTPARGQE